MTGPSATGEQATLKITIVTVCRNAASSIEKTIWSVLWQDYPNVEYAVIDGLSTDDTWSIVQKYRDQIAVLVHEPDTGIYDAMNKGVRLSTGDVLAFINADDYLASPYVLSRVARTFDAHPEVDVVYGDYVYDTGWETHYHRQPNRVGRWYFMNHNPSIMHQSMFYRRRAFDTVGLFDTTTLRISADKDWNIRGLLVSKLPYLHIPVVVSYSSRGGLSTTAGLAGVVEKDIIMRRYFGRTGLAYWRLKLTWTSLRERTRFRLRSHDFRPPRVIRDLAARWKG
jgi:glycosyltransferase involved in cell wall biosynthesis